MNCLFACSSDNQTPNAETCIGTEHSSIPRDILLCSVPIEIPSPRNFTASKHQAVIYFDEPPSYEHPPSYEEAKLIQKYYKLPKN